MLTKGQRVYFGTDAYLFLKDYGNGYGSFKPCFPVARQAGRRTYSRRKSTKKRTLRFNQLTTAR